MNNVRVTRLEADAKKPHIWGSRNGMSLAAYAKSPTGHNVNIMIPPRSPRLIRTGIGISVPEGYMSFLMSRREDAKKGLFVVNAPAPLEGSDEVKFVLYNGGLETQIVSHGDLVANLIIITGSTLSFEVL